MLHTRWVQRILSLLILVVATAPVFAASHAERERLAPMTDAEALSRFQPTQIRAYREQLNAILAKERELIAVTGQERLMRLVDQKIDQLQKIDDADFARFMTLNVDLSQLDRSVNELHQRMEAKQSERVTSQGLKIKTNSTGFPDASYSFCGSGRSDATFMLAAQEVLIAAKGVWSAASRGCDEVVVVAGFGGNVSLVCIIADGVLAIAEGVLNGFEFCDNDIDSAEIQGSYKRLAHIHGDLESAQTTIVDNQNTNKSDVTNAVSAAQTAITNSIDAAATAIINNDNTNRNAIINNDNTNKNTIVNNDNANRDAIENNDNVNRNTIMANDNANRDTIMANDNHNRDLMIAEMRMIGCDMIRLINTPEGQRASALQSCVGQPGYPYVWPQKKLQGGGVSVSAFALPMGPEAPMAVSRERSVTMETYLAEGRMLPSYYLPSARGGLLEQVKDLVWSTIASQSELTIAPDETASARLEAEKADALLNAERFVDAYRQYSVAYRHLIPKS
jgi:hypothetical protein